MAQDRNGGRRPAEEQEMAAWRPITRSEMLPIVEHPSDRIRERAAGEIFTTRSLTFARETLATGEAGEVTIRKIRQDPDGSQHIYEAVCKSPVGGNDKIEIELRGDAWKSILERLSEDSLIRTNAQGTFHRKRARAKPDEEPIAKDGDIIEPGGTIGMMEIMKVWEDYILPADKFPKGGKMLRFALENDDAQVEQGTVICYVEKIE